MKPSLAWAGRLLAASVFLLASCAELSTRAPSEEVVFELAGRLAARHADESFSGQIGWRHARDRDEMLITTPLGQGVARIVREPSGVILTTAEPKEYRAADAEALTEEVLGFRLPLAGLADWVRARPSPNGGQARTEASADGRLRTLEQDGWKVEYQAYEGALPSRLRLTYPGVDLRLAISEWK